MDPVALISTASVGNVLMEDYVLHLMYVHVWLHLLDPNVKICCAILAVKMESVSLSMAEPDATVMMDGNQNVS
jgi:hypothetical protein